MRTNYLKVKRTVSEAIKINSRDGNEHSYGLLLDHKVNQNSCSIEIIGDFLHCWLPAINCILSLNILPIVYLFECYPGQCMTIGNSNDSLL